MKNFLYCFDSNYNIQGFCSTYSLLENLDEPANIFIIHKDPKTFSKLQKKLEQHQNLNSLDIYKFQNYDFDFPNISNKHVSEATYYRLFISKYIPDDIKHLIYIDADAFFLNPLKKDLYPIFENFQKSNFGIAAKTTNEVLDDPTIKELGLTKSMYFNAGILFIDYERWRNEKYFVKLIDILENSKIQFKSWDQDILNIFFDGNYFELNEELNFNINRIERKNENQIDLIEKNVTIIHYIGSPKPWNIKGLFYPGYIFFYNIFRDLFNEVYFLNINNRKNFISFLIKVVLLKERIYVDKKIKFLEEIIFALFLKKDKNIIKKIKKLKL
jgi:UDP-glucose:(galactosyl)LPS alpha-1,2-glucosyltransferase